MTFRNQMKEPNNLMRLGLVCLVLGILSQRFVHPSSHLSAAFIDGMTGFLFGVSIACLLMSIRLKGRRRTGTTPRMETGAGS